MRAGLAVLATLLLAAGCDSGEVPSPAELAEGAAAGEALAADVVELRGEGLSAGAEAFYFAAGQKEVEAALARVLGPAMRSGANPDCPAGPITFTDFPGGLTAHFQEGRLVGWNWHQPQDGDAPGRGGLRLSGSKVALASPRAVAEAAPGFAPIAGSTLGEEFALGEKIGGFIKDDAVEMLYAGTQCFFR